MKRGGKSLTVFSSRNIFRLGWRFLTILMHITRELILPVSNLNTGDKSTLALLNNFRTRIIQKKKKKFVNLNTFSCTGKSRSIFLENFPSCFCRAMYMDENGNDKREKGTC